MKCICAPRGLSVDPRCPIHMNEATNGERRRYGLPQRPHSCPVTMQQCARNECATYCAGPIREAADGVRERVMSPSGKGNGGVER